MKKWYEPSSLTGRIWLIFTLLILGISLCLAVVFNQLHVQIIQRDVLVAHELLMENYIVPSKNHRIYDNKHLSRVSHYWIGIRGYDVKAKSIDGQMDSDDQQFLEQIMDQIVHVEKGQLQQSRVSKWKYTWVSDSLSNGEYLLSYYAVPRGYIMTKVIPFIGMILLVGLLLAKIIANYIAKPLIQLEQYAQKIARKNWVEPLPVQGEDEISYLIRGMNEMQRLLKQQEEEERVFLQSISHDLKTPIMVIMGHAQAIIDGVYIDNVETNAQIIKEEAVRLEGKVKKILYFNTLDYMLEHDSFLEKVDLLEVIQDAHMRLIPIKKELRWEIIGESIAVIGDVEKLQVAIENICDNALRYGKTKIRVTLSRQDQWAVMDIFNDGPAISEQQKENIFNSLYKDRRGNFGLGLFISKKIVEFYQGEIEVTNQEEGVNFSVKLPLV